MHNCIAAARKEAGYSQPELAREMHLSLRAYQYLEYGERELTPEQALQLSRILCRPELTMVYCRKNCAIGRAYCYDILNNVDLSPMAILAKYRQEAREAQEALDNLTELMLNKAGAQDCTQAELSQIRRWTHELLDLEHVVETLKFRLWDFLDVGELVQEHNQKCMDRRYYCNKKPALKAG